MSLEAGTFLGVQSDDHRQGLPQRRKQVNLILSYDYVQEPFDRAGILIDATTQTTIEWVNALRDALGLAPLEQCRRPEPRSSARARTHPPADAHRDGAGRWRAGAGWGDSRRDCQSAESRADCHRAADRDSHRAAERHTKWAFATGASVSATVAVVDGVVYAGSWDGTLYALDAATGEKRWSFAAGGSTQFQILKPPTVAGGLVYVQAANPTDAFAAPPLYALRSADGSKDWSLPQGIPVVDTYAQVLVANGVLYVPSYNDGRWARSIRRPGRS